MFVIKTNNGFLKRIHHGYLYNTKSNCLIDDNWIFDTEIAAKNGIDAAIADAKNEIKKQQKLIFYFKHDTTLEILQLGEMYKRDPIYSANHTCTTIGYFKNRIINYKRWINDINKNIKKLKETKIVSIDNFKLKFKSNPITNCGGTNKEFCCKCGIYKIPTIKFIPIYRGHMCILCLERLTNMNAMEINKISPEIKDQYMKELFIRGIAGKGN